MMPERSNPGDEFVPFAQGYISSVREQSYTPLLFCGKLVQIIHVLADQFEEDAILVIHQLHTLTSTFRPNYTPPKE